MGKKKLKKEIKKMREAFELQRHDIENSRQQTQKALAALERERKQKEDVKSELKHLHFQKEQDAKFAQMHDHIKHLESKLERSYLENEIKSFLMQEERSKQELEQLRNKISQLEVLEKQVDEQDNQIERLTDELKNVHHELNQTTTFHQQALQDNESIKQQAIKALEAKATELNNLMHAHGAELDRQHAELQSKYERELKFELTSQQAALREEYDAKLKDELAKQFAALEEKYNANQTIKQDAKEADRRLVSHTTTHQQPSHHTLFQPASTTLCNQQNPSQQARGGNANASGPIAVAAAGNNFSVSPNVSIGGKEGTSDTEKNSNIDKLGNVSGSIIAIIQKTTRCAVM